MQPLTMQVHLWTCETDRNFIMQYTLAQKPMQLHAVHSMHATGFFQYQYFSRTALQH